ncbi:hypothetical protein BH09BAC5_BH09BAC5_09370 [soil metagenome]
MAKKKEEVIINPGDIPILLKIGEYFIQRNEIRSVARFGKGSKIILSNGNELIVQVNYDKVMEIVK